MKNTCSRKMKKLQKREPSLYVALMLFAAALLLFALTPAIAGMLGGAGGAAAAGNLTGAAASVVFYLPRVVLAAGFMALFFFIRRVAERRARLEGLDAERLQLADQMCIRDRIFSCPKRSAASFIMSTFSCTLTSRNTALAPA